MNNLNIINQNGVLLTDSREVAGMVDKQHKDLIESIRGYVQYLIGGDFRASDFFIKSSYTDTQNREQPCYLLTKKGCDMVANKMTGEKGILFTATYVTKFEEMEQTLKPSKPTCIEDVLIQSLQQMKDMRQQLNEANQNALQANAKAEETKQEVQAIRDVITINPKAEWRKQTNYFITSICMKLSDFETPRIEIYKALEQRGACNMKQRLKNLQGRALLNGMSKSKADSLNNLDVLENEPRLKEIYISIVKEMAIKHKVA